MSLTDKAVLSVLHLLIVVCYLRHASIAKSCDEIVPGLQKLVEGVDITKLDLFPLSNSEDPKHGFRNAIVDFTCNNGKKKKIDGTTYDFPDQVESMEPETRSLQIFKTQIINSESQIKKTLSANAGIKAEAVVAAFSASSTYSKMQEDLAGKKLYILQACAESETFVMKLKPHLSLTLEENAQSVLNDLPSTFAANPSAYLKFIEMFGTHYFSQGKLGGAMVVTVETKSSSLQTLDDKMFKVNVDALVKDIFSAEAGGAAEKEKNYKVAELREASTIIKKYYGGKESLASKDLAEWQKTIAKAPYFISGSLEPISDLIRDEQKKKEMEKAVQFHLLLAKMADLDRLTDIRRNNWKTGSSQLKFVQEKLEHLTNLRNQNSLKITNLEDSLQDIENQVRVPEWFTNKTSFCFESDARGNKAQCNGKDNNKFCAPPNLMTHPYHDMTDTRDGGCGMKWSLLLGNALKPSDTWLKSTKILFRWYSVWSPCACGGRDGKDGVPFVLSAASDSWTQEYFDDTSEKHGECIMQWKLEVPTNAPAWAQNIHLCFDFSCGNLKDCVPANYWTPPYMDISSAGTSCSMSWGLQIF